MNNRQWEDRLKTLFGRTAEELKRTGQDLRAEAERLLTEVKDPARQQKIREGLEDFSAWARKTAEDVASLVENQVKRAEDVVVKATDRVVSSVAGRSWSTPPPPGARPGSSPHGATAPGRPKAARKIARALRQRQARKKKQKTSAP